MRILIIGIILSICQLSYCQRINFDTDRPVTNNLFIKFYGEVDYNQKIKPDTYTNGNIDVHRMVTLFGYQFSKKTQFVAEIEYEHVKEVFIEQAWAKHQLASNHFLKAGLLLIPMGYVNENHEPTTFYSVERPLIDKIIVPTTWREIGLGLTGIFPEQSLKYKFFLVNGLKSYDHSNGGLFSISKPFRSGRQKGAESTISGLPNISAQLEYFGFSNLKIALSLYRGETNSDLYNGLSKDDELGIAAADSSVIKMNMVAIHSQYKSGRFGLNTQFVYNYSENAEAYAGFTGNDLSSSIYGFYFEPVVVLYNNNNIDHLSWFGRYSRYDLNSSGEGSDYVSNIYTTGLNWKPTPGLVFKTDLQYFVEPSENFFQYNLGVGVWF